MAALSQGVRIARKKKKKQQQVVGEREREGELREGSYDGGAGTDGLEGEQPAMGFQSSKSRIILGLVF